MHPVNEWQVIFYNCTSELETRLKNLTQRDCCGKKFQLVRCDESAVPIWYPSSHQQCIIIPILFTLYENYQTEQ